MKVLAVNDYYWSKPVHREDNTRKAKSRFPATHRLSLCQADTAAMRQLDGVPSAEMC